MNETTVRKWLAAFGFRRDQAFQRNTGAIPQSDHAEGLLSPKLNTGMINSLLKQFSESLPDGIQAVMVWDGVGFHRSQSLEVPANVSLIQLPPRTGAQPDAPIENLWHFLKSHYWSNRDYKDYDALEEAAMTAWKNAVLDKELMKNVCAALNTQNGVVTFLRTVQSLILVG